jgi:hypothetical protein
MKMHTHPSNELPLWAWIAIALVLLVQGGWLFYDARRRGRFPWIWGIWGLMSFPLPTVLYLIFDRKLFRRAK